MVDINLCKFEGILFKNPVNFSKSSDNVVARFKIAVDSDFERNGKNYVRVDYIDCVAFSGNATQIMQMKKDDSISVDAKVQNRSYFNSENKKIYVNDFVIEKIN